MRTNRGRGEEGVASEGTKRTTRTTRTDRREPNQATPLKYNKIMSWITEAMPVRVYDGYSTNRHKRSSWRLEREKSKDRRTTHANVRPRRAYLLKRSSWRYEPKKGQAASTHPLLDPPALQSVICGRRAACRANLNSLLLIQEGLVMRTRLGLRLQCAGHPAGTCP